MAEKTDDRFKGSYWIALIFLALCPVLLVVTGTTEQLFNSAQKIRVNTDSLVVSEFDYIVKAASSDARWKEFIAEREIFVVVSGTKEKTYLRIFSRTGRETTFVLVNSIPAFKRRCLLTEDDIHTIFKVMQTNRSNGVLLLIKKLGG